MLVNYQVNCDKFISAQQHNSIEFSSNRRKCESSEKLFKNLTKNSELKFSRNNPENKDFALFLRDFISKKVLFSLILVGKWTLLHMWHKRVKLKK